MSKIIKILAISILFTSNAYAVDECYQNGYEDGFNDGEKSFICLAVVPEICDEKGNLLPTEQRIYNGDPRCYIDVLENCYEKKQENTAIEMQNSKNKYKKLKRKFKKLRKR